MLHLTWDEPKVIKQVTCVQNKAKKYSVDTMLTEGKNMMLLMKQMNLFLSLIIVTESQVITKSILLQTDYKKCKKTILLMEDSLFSI